MSVKDFTANVISATSVVPDGNFKTSKASGIWDMNEALDLIKSGNWPNATNIDPATFAEGLFQTSLYIGNGGGRATIDNGMDLKNKGGLVWIKARESGENHGWFDTKRGIMKLISSDTTTAEATNTGTLVEFKDDGFVVDGNGIVGSSTDDYVAWTWRLQPKFFDIVEYTGTGSARTVAHSLDHTVGMLIIKNLDEADNWAVYHRANTGAPQTDYLILNTTAATADNANWWNDTAPTTSEFTVGTDHSVNADGERYIAYLFAHHDDDGGFGLAGDQDIIHCGTYDGNGSNTGVFQDLGFEPQWIMVKLTNAADPWVILDSMRVVAGVSSNDPRLVANTDGAEANGEIMQFQSSGFTPLTTDAKINGSSKTYVYMAIRRGGMAVPTAASQVFNVLDHPNDASDIKVEPGFPTDMFLTSKTGEASNKITAARLMGIDGNGGIIQTSQTTAQSDDYSAYLEFAHQDGVKWKDLWGNQPAFDLHWKRAKGFFDVVCYTGTGANRTVAHGLGVAPDMMWIKNLERTSDWAVYVSGITHLSVFGADENGSRPARLELNTTENAQFSGSGNWNHTHPTSTVFTTGDTSAINASGERLVAYLFATLAGVSKVGSFTQSGATNVDCGFSGDTPSLIILKRVDANSGNWLTFTSVTGIVAGNDPHTPLNVTTQTTTNEDVVDPYSGGFATTSTLTNGVYIFYAIAAVS